MPSRRAWQTWLTVAVALQLSAALLYAWYRGTFDFGTHARFSTPDHVANQKPPQNQETQHAQPENDLSEVPANTNPETHLVPDPPIPNVVVAQPRSCQDYTGFSMQQHEPYSSGIHKLSSQRPDPACRTFNSSIVEKTIEEYKGLIKDPDLFVLFENTFPNTLDTTIKWRGHAENRTDEELTFIITGDINAMWLRDSSAQIHPYAALIEPSEDFDSLASLFRGAINLQARSIKKEPWCNAYQAPPESKIHTSWNGAPYTISPHMDMSFCFTPNFELDSFGGFFMISDDYYNKTKDADFFGRYDWIDAVREILRVARAQTEGFYDEETGNAKDPAYAFNSQTKQMTGTLGNDGLGNPVRATGMIKAPFRPSDDTSTYQFLIPSNMMFASYLGKVADIMAHHDKGLAKEMTDMSQTIRAAVEKHGVVPHPDGSGKKIYAFEVDGFGGQNLMDDANVPSLLSAPLLEYVQPSDPHWDIYQNTREFVLSTNNPWYIKGSVITGIGSPHTSVAKVWPMALITRILTSDSDEEIIDQLRQLISSTTGLGLMHESVHSSIDTLYSRQWFAWANSFFGQMMMDLRVRKPHLLATSFQQKT